MAIDYGRKRCGIAVSDPLQIIANRLTTVSASDIFSFLTDYLQKEKVELIIIGYPVDMQNRPAEALKYINPFIKKLIKSFPEMNVELVDERFTSNIAFQTMLDAGLKKKDRRNKGLIDAISATIILQSWLEKAKDYT